MKPIKPMIQTLGGGVGEGGGPPGVGCEVISFVCFICFYICFMSKTNKIIGFHYFTCKTNVKSIKTNAFVGFAYKTSVKTNETNKTNDPATNSRSPPPAKPIKSLVFICFYIGFIRRTNEIINFYNFT